MLLSPLGSPSRFTAASFSLPLPHLQHELINCDCEDDDDEAFGSIGSISSDDENDTSSDSDESASSRTSLSDDAADDALEVDVDSALVLVDDYASPTDVDPSVEAEPLPPPHSSPPPSSPPLVLASDSLAYPKRRSGPELPVEGEASELALPVELIFAIVELAASHRRTAVSLCRVASWVRAAVLPILYGTLVLQGSERALPFDAVGDDERVALGGGDDDGGGSGTVVRRLESPLKHVRSLWLDVPADRAPRSLDACVRLRQLALPLEAHATICNTQRWLAYDPRSSHSTPTTTARKSNALHVDGIDSDARASDDASGVTCRSFTVLGQSHPHRWAPLTSSPNGRAFLRGVTHLRILNLCLSHYIPLEYTPNLTHLCIPFFDLRISPSTLSSSPTALDLSDTSSLTGSAATSSFTGLDYILSSPSLQMVVLTLNPRYWRFDELSLKGWAIRAMARDPRLYVVAETRDDATRDWEVPRRDWEDEARGGAGAGAGGGRMSVWEKAVCVRRKFLTRLSRSWGEGYRV